MISINIKSKMFQDVPVLGPINLDIAAGETVAIVGPSGVGKSTLLRIAAGIDTQFEGTVTRPEKLAFVFQEPTLLPWRSAIENVTLAHADVSKASAQAVLDEVGLTGKAELFPGQLSLGQQRRLSLARACAGSPEVLILDEPFASLDPETAEVVIGLTERLIATYKPATLFVTHSKAEATRLGHRIARLDPSASGAILRRTADQGR
ncbi:MAG: ABC transporter ATP-binding protein [Pseudomonadota bacterium]